MCILGDALARDRLALMLRGHAVIGTTASAALFLLSVVSGTGDGFDPLTEPISNLALRWTWWAVAVAFAAGGLGCFALAIALWRILGISSWPATTLMALGSICILLLGLFPTDGQVVPRTTDGRIHAVVASFGFVLVEASLLLHSHRLRQELGRRRLSLVLSILARASLVLLLMAAALALGSMQTGEYLPFTGLAERLLVGCMLSWTIFASLNLTRLAPLVPKQG
jgi:hypothetical protein